MRLQFVGGEAVGGGALLPPLAGPDLGTPKDGVGVDRVDPDAGGGAFEGEAAGEVDLGRLCGAVGGGTRRGGEAVLGGDEDDRPPQPLRPEQAEGLAGDEEVAGGEDVDIARPHGERGVLDRGRGGDSGVGDQDVEPAKLGAGGGEARLDGGLVGHVDLDRAHLVVAEGLGEARLGLVERRLVDVGKHDAGAFLQQPQGNRPTDPAAAAGDEGDASRHRLGPWHPLQLRLLQKPVLDVERLLLGQALVGVDGRGAAHHVDGVDVELGGDPRRRLVAGERDHAHAGHEVDDGVGVAHGRRVVVPAAFVVAGVIGPVGLKRLGQRLEHGVEIGGGGVEVEDEGADLGAQEVVGAGGPECRERSQIRRAHEFEHRVAVVEVADLALVLADQPPDRRHQPCRDGTPRGRYQRLDPLAAEDRLARRLVLEPRDRLVDDPQRRLVAVPCRVTPGEQAVAFEDDALGVRILGGELGQVEPQLEARPAPGQPADLVAVDLARDRPAVLRRRDRDHCVGVHMVDVTIGKVGVESRVDRRRAWVEGEGAVRKVADHLIFMCRTPVEAAQPFQLVHVEGGEPVELHRADVAAGALHPEHRRHLAAERVCHLDLGRGVAAAVVGDPLVGAEQVRAVEEPTRLVQPGRHPVVPQARQALAVSRFRHVPLPDGRSGAVSRRWRRKSTNFRHKLPYCAATWKYLIEAD